MKYAVPVVGFLVLACSVSAQAEPSVRDVVDARLRGDRTGACMAVAVIEAEHVEQLYRCAHAADEGRVGPASAFEIGSVTKTMTATLLALRIERGEAQLDDPLASLLPPDTKVPSYQGTPITLRHVVTHTSGLPALPARFQPRNPDDPYADLTEAALLASLGDVTLTAAPGTQFSYSNFAFMVLSLGLARQAHVAYPALLARELFAPLGMKSAYLTAPPPGVEPAKGHMSNGTPAAAWNFPENLGGVGAVRATLGDMIRYVRAELGQLPTPLAPALRRTQQKVLDGQQSGMSWRLLELEGRTLHAHEGGTGGFSSFVAFEVARQHGVIVLSDTSWNALGGLGSLAAPLVDASSLPGRPRTVQTPPPELLAGLAGDYVLATGLPISLRVEDGKLVAQAAGQPAFVLDYDSEGDFFPRTFDAVLRPRREPDGYSFTLVQGGGAAPAKRVSKSPLSEPRRRVQAAPRAR